MIIYKYTAKNPKTGEKVTAEIQADSVAKATKLVQQQGLTPISVKAVQESTGGFKFGRRAKVKLKDKVIFSRQLATLIGAGLPLVQSLRNILQQTPNKVLRVIISEIIGDIEGGKSFSVALARHPSVFDNVFVNLIAAGEVSGTLDKSLERLADQQEKDAEILGKVRGALIYPAVVVAVMVVVVGFMVVVVLPEVGKLYQTIPGADLPFITKVMLAFSSFVRHFWWAIIIFLGGAAFATSRWARTGPGKEFIDGLKLKMWPVAKLFQKMYMARFARTGSILIGSGVPLIKMLETASNSITNIHVERSVKKAIEKVKSGKSLSAALTGDPNFLELVPNMLKVGEDSGSLQTMMEKTADYYEKEVDAEIKAMSTLIEPMLMVLLGVVALIIVAAVLLPIYGLANKIW